MARRSSAILLTAASVCDAFTDASRQASLAASRPAPAQLAAFVIDDATGFYRSKIQLEAIGLAVQRIDPVYLNETACAGAGVANMSRSTMRKKVGVAAAHLATWSAIAQAVERGTLSLKDPVLVLEADWSDESDDQRRDGLMTRDVVQAAANRTEDYVMLGWCGLSTTVAYMVRASVARWLSQLPQGGCGLVTEEEMGCPVDWCGAACSRWPLFAAIPRALASCDGVSPVCTGFWLPRSSTAQCRSAASRALLERATGGGDTFSSGCQQILPATSSRDAIITRAT